MCATVHPTIQDVIFPKASSKKPVALFSVSQVSAFEGELKFSLCTQGTVCLLANASDCVCVCCSKFRAGPQITTRTF